MSPAVEAITGYLPDELYTDAEFWPSRLHPDDREELEAHLCELDDDARGAIPGGGRILIETSTAVIDEAKARASAGLQAGEYVTLSVQDTGAGMDEATLSRVFELFFTTKEQGKGTRLGLPTVHGIAKRKGGEVLIDSTPGERTTVRVYLPIGPGAREEWAAQGARGPCRHRDHPGRLTSTRSPWGMSWRLGFRHRDGREDCRLLRQP